MASSQCFGTSGRLALAPVADWLRSPAVRSATETLDQAWRAEVDRLVPSGPPGGARVGSQGMIDAWQRLRFFEGLARALLAVGRPMVLVLDNMQWCDQETLAFLTFCLGLSATAQILVAGTLRNDNIDHEPRSVPGPRRCGPPDCSPSFRSARSRPADTARLAEAISGRPLSAADSSLLHATTGGFPLYVIEAARGSVEQGRAGVCLKAT